MRSARSYSGTSENHEIRIGFFMDAWHGEIVV